MHAFSRGLDPLALHRYLSLYTANKFSASLQFLEIDLFALCCTCFAHAGLLAAGHAALASLDVQTCAACGYFFPFLIPSLLLLFQFITPDVLFSIPPVD
jgi:hypothetical protein